MLVRFPPITIICHMNLSMQASLQIVTAYSLKTTVYSYLMRILPDNSTALGTYTAVSR